MDSKFKVGQRVRVNWGPYGNHIGTVARIDYCFGYLYIVDLDGIGAKQVNSVMMEAL